MSSNIPLARRILRDALANRRGGLRDAVEAALELMTRSAPVRRAPNRRQRITKAMVAEVKRYARTNPRKTEHQIANACGIENSGRVSEILNNKRKGH